MKLPKCPPWFVAAAILARTVSCQDVETGNHPDWPRWCGKVYKVGYPSFDPGGQTVPPTRVPGGPLLHLQVKPRHSLYLTSDKQGEIIVNAAFSQYHGTPWNKSNSTVTPTPDRSDWLVFSVHLVENDDVIVANKVMVNTTGNIFAFELSRLKPSLQPIQLILYGAPERGNPTWTATTSVYYLPEKKNGSVTKLDNLNGGMWFRNAASGGQFKPLLAYGFYSSYDGFLGNNSTREIQRYADLGLNAITPLTIYRDSAAAFSYMDNIDLKFMYNLREGYKNLTYVREQVTAARNAEAVFAYWSADEPDGWQDPFSAPALTYNLIRELDPYHPVAVVLNCQNYYFAEYTVGADIIMEDVYPIGINSTWSKWGTACNTTLGDCGCDSCQGNVQDVSTRLDTLSQYETWLGLWPKTKIHNPQSFHGQDYWFRDPSPDEEYVMCLLALNHGAQGIISWVYPTSEILGAAHGALSKVVTRSPVVDFVVGGDRPHEIPVAIPGVEVVDAAYWVVGGKMLVSVVNGGYADVYQTVSISAPNATIISSIPWGSVEWKLENFKLSVSKLPAMATSLIIVDLLGE